MTVRTSSAPTTAALIGGHRVEYHQTGGWVRRTYMFGHRMQRGSGSRRRDRLSQSLFCLCSAGPARVCGTVPSGEKDEGTFSLDWNTRVTSDLLYYTRSSSAGKVMWVARQAIGLRRRQVVLREGGSFRPHPVRYVVNKPHTHASTLRGRAQATPRGADRG